MKVFQKILGGQGFRNIDTTGWSLLILAQYIVNKRFNVFFNFGGALLRTKFLQLNIPNATNVSRSVIANNKNYHFSTILPELRIGLNWNFTRWIGFFISYTHIFGVYLNNDTISYLENDAVLALPSTASGINTWSAGINITWDVNKVGKMFNW